VGIYKKKINLVLKSYAYKIEHVFEDRALGGKDSRIEFLLVSVSLKGTQHRIGGKKWTVL